MEQRRQGREAGSMPTPASAGAADAAGSGHRVLWPRSNHESEVLSDSESLVVLVETRRHCSELVPYAQAQRLVT